MKYARVKKDFSKVIDAWEDIIYDIVSGMPTYKALINNNIQQPTFFFFIDENPEYANKYARAKAMQQEAKADELLDIADNMEIPSDQKRVMVDTRKWIASKEAPKKYGEKVINDINVHTYDLFDDELQKRADKLNADITHSKKSNSD